MSRFGWAYVNSIISGAVANGPTNSVQFNSGSQILSGSSNFTFDPISNILVVTGTISASTYQGVTPSPAGSDKQIQYNSGSALAASSNLTFDYSTNTLYLTGTLRADNLIVSSSQILKSGSTIFGDDLSDTHQFTGSILGGIVSGTISRFTTITGSTITGSTGLFTTLTASSAFFNSISASVAQFDTLTASNSLVTNITTIGNYVQLLPVDITIPTLQTASYIYTSGSTNDLYFSQFSGSLTNTTRLRWIEGALGTGLQYGGLLSTVTGTTTFNVSAGGGIIVTQNASTSSDPYPTIKQVNWSNYVSQSLLYSGSAQITYVSIDTNGLISQSESPPTLAQYKDRIVLGRVLHQSASITNGTINSPAMSYAQTANIFDFIRSFGPLKISGHFLAASGSTLGITKTAGASYSEGRNYSSDPDQPNIILASAETDITITKIFREYVSGSTPIIDTNGNLGYSVIDPSKYNNNGTLAAVGNSEWTNQRVYWFPKSVNQALFVYYGTQKYGSKLEAIAGLLTENFSEGANTLNAAIYVGSITLKGNETNLSDTTNVSISQAGLFRALAGGGGGSGGGASPPAGLTTEVQFNDGGVFAGDADFTFNKTTNTLSVLNLSASSITAFGANQSIQYNNAGVLNGSSNLTFDGTQVRLTGSLAVISGSTIVAEALSSGFRTTGKPIQVRNAGSVLVGVIDETGTISGSIGRFTTLTASVVTASSELQVSSNATIGGNILGSGAFKAGYLTYTGSFNVPTSAYFVGMSTTGSVLTASLGSATTYPAGQTLIFKDIGGNAGTNNIRITPSGSQTIDGATGFIVATNSGSVTLISNGTDQFYIAGTF